MAIRRRERRSDRSKIDATPPWERRKPAVQSTTTGPFDVADAPEDDTQRIDLGCLRIPASELEMRVDVSEVGEVVSVTVAAATGQMQLAAFAAPRNEGIWDEVRAEIAAGVSDQGGTTADEDGEFGTDLVGRLGREAGGAPVRFIGVDGPRWLLRAMIVGPAATDSRELAPFHGILRDIVVVRGNQPLPVREPIPLRLPPEVAEQLAAPDTQA